MENISLSLSVKKKKPKLLNKFDKAIKAELDAAEKLRKRVGCCFCFAQRCAVVLSLKSWGL